MNTRLPVVFLANGFRQAFQVLPLQGSDWGFGVSSYHPHSTRYLTRLHLTSSFAHQVGSTFSSQSRLPTQPWPRPNRPAKRSIPQNITITRDFTIMDTKNYGLSKKTQPKLNADVHIERMKDMEKYNKVLSNGAAKWREPRNKLK